MKSLNTSGKSDRAQVATSKIVVNSVYEEDQSPENKGAFEEAVNMVYDQLPSSKDDLLRQKDIENNDKNIKEVKWLSPPGKKFTRNDTQVNNSSGDIALPKGPPNLFASSKAGIAPRTNNGFLCQ